MKRIAIATMLALAVAAISLRVRADNGLTQAALDALTPIESTATPNELTLVFGGGSGSAAATAAVSTLATIISDPAQDVGVQVRAVRDLGDYPAVQAAHDELVALLASATTSNRGAKVVLLRAAIEAFGSLGSSGNEQAGDVDRLTPFLDHASQDIRAATAVALGNLCDPAAIQPLRNRFGQELEGSQVQFAISEALRVLGSCGT